MPECSGLGARLLLQLGENEILSLGIFIPGAQAVQGKERACRANVIYIVLRALVVCTNGAVLGNNGVVPGIDVIENRFIPTILIDVEEGKQLEAGGVIPL